jgi:FMN-dependent oxidoreductase (nitrilotriacetate monooxygenase family)
MSHDTSRKMSINLFMHGSGHHEAAWRLPASRPGTPLDFEHYRHAATIAENAKLDSIFFADGLATGMDVRRNLMGVLEPIGLLAALSAVTTRIGLIATASSSYNEPFNLARRFASLDHMSNGRAGWNLVTSGSLAEARNFGLDEVPAHADRYRRAEEFIEVTTKLWDSWEDDALRGDKESGVYVETDLLHAADHEGEFFKVAGPLGVPRSPQGRPVLVQAGSSEEGRDFAGTYAEAVFTAQRTLAEGQDFYADLKRRAVAAGRDPSQIVILPGISPFIGSTEAEAKAVERELHELVQPEYALRQLAVFLEYEFTVDQLDEKFPDLPDEAPIEGHKSRYELIVGLARSEDLTLRQLIGRLAGGRGHRTLVGTPEQIADDLQLWFENGAADGFNFMPPSIPDQLEVFVDSVLPILRERGLFRTEYEGATLRDHYGLERPGNVNAARSAEPIAA